MMPPRNTFIAANTISPLRKGSFSTTVGPSVVMPSCASLITTTPISAPVTEPMPPTMIIAMNQIEFSSVNWSTATKRT